MHFRNLVEIPRLTSDAKRSILGISAVGEFSKIRVQKEISEKGHPLADVVDLTPGSGAACIAALYSNIFYIGFGHNEAHRDWIQDLIKRMLVAMVQNKTVVADADLVKNVGVYLQRSAEAAKLLLPKSGAAFGDSFTGDNDSDAEDI